MSDNTPASPSAAFRNSVIRSIRQTSSDYGNQEGVSTPLRAAQQNSSIPTGVADTSLPPKDHLESSQLMSNFINSSPGKVASQLFLKPLGRRRSSLFESLATKSGAEKSFLFSRQRSSQPSTLLEKDFQSPRNSQLAPRTGSSSTSNNKASLFGEVMKKFGSTTTNSIPGTPTRMSSLGTDSSENRTADLMSPSGKTLVNMVNRFTSPFRFHSPKPKRRLMPYSSQSNESSKSSFFTPSPGRKRRRLYLENEDSISSLHDDENWQEAPIENKQVEILDWSLKTHLRLECHPESLQAVVTSREWMEHLNYYSYPTRLPTRRNLLQPRRNGSIGTRITENQKEEPSQLQEKTSHSLEWSTNLASKLVKSVKGPTATISRTNGDGCLSTQAPQREWQEALRSLFQLWCRKLENLSQESVKEAILDYYFYCVGEDHVLLFRVEAQGAAPYYRHRVLLSNCFGSFQRELENIGIARTELLGKGRNQKLSRSDKDVPMSPTVKADLEALRRAQAYGECAGADVFVKIHKKATHQDSTEPDCVGPLSVTGFDDVSAFLEVYLNSFGCVNGNPSNCLPMLLCRGLGPFRHSSLMSLSTYPSKEQNDFQSNEGDRIEIEGIIMPCAVRKLVAMVAISLAKEQAEKQDTCLELASSTMKDENIGSRYLVLHSFTEKQQNAMLGANGSLFFNGWDEGAFNERDILDHVYECPRTTVLQLIVWDISRLQVVACKIEPVSALPK